MADSSAAHAGKGKTNKLGVPEPKIFFHSITGEPLLPNPCDPDSEDEDRESWFQQSELADIDDYDDLQPSDKEFFKAISQAMRKDLNSTDRRVKEVLIDFVAKGQHIGKAFRVYLALLLQKNILTGDDAYHILLELRKKCASSLAS